MEVEKSLGLRCLPFPVKEDGAVAMERNYPSDLTDEQWQLVKNQLPNDFPNGYTVYTVFTRWPEMGVWEPCIPVVFADSAY